MKLLGMFFFWMKYKKALFKLGGLFLGIMFVILLIDDLEAYMHSIWVVVAKWVVVAVGIYWANKLIKKSRSSLKTKRTHEKKELLDHYKKMEFLETKVQSKIQHIVAARKHHAPKSFEREGESLQIMAR